MHQKMSSQHHECCRALGGAAQRRRRKLGAVRSREGEPLSIRSATLSFHSSLLCIRDVEKKGHFKIRKIRSHGNIVK